MSKAIADFDRHRNDLYWKVWAGDDKFIRWIGYDDANWWNNVSHAEHVRTRVGPATGRVFTIDFATCEVTISSPAISAARGELLS